MTPSIQETFERFYQRIVYLEAVHSALGDEAARLRETTNGLVKDLATANLRIRLLTQFAVGDIELQQLEDEVKEEMLRIKEERLKRLKPLDQISHEQAGMLGQERV